MKDLFSFIATIRWQDVVDILINSYILFRIYVLFQGTNAFRVLVGITSLWILQEVAASMGLILTSWVVRGITAAAAIIIIVVFRNEIRSALQARNLKTFLWGSPNQEQATPVEIIADSVYQMGRKRVGALIVIPGREDFSEIVHGGIQWNGTLSQEMLLSIFWPKNPVHDGAIIIQNNRVTEVGVLLPLSQRMDLPTFYGTRHRAAAGLAERSDALVIVVSEERGRVTIAKGHTIKAVAQPEELVQILKEHLNLFDQTKQQKKREQLRLTAAALISLIIVAGIWFGFTRSRDTFIALNVPIEYVNRPTNLEILNTSIDEVRLQLYGSSALIRSLRPGQVQVRIDLGKAAEGRNSIPITQENIVLPPGVFLNKVEPPTVDVMLDVPITKELPVQVDWAGHLPDNLVLKEMKVLPAAVQVVGGSKILDKVETIYTAPVRLDNLTKSGSLTVSLILTPASLKLAPNSSERVTDNYVIEERHPTDKRGSLHLRHRYACFKTGNYSIPSQAIALAGLSGLDHRTLFRIYPQDPRI
ncbi:diadenylate cyclase [Desulfoferrobacter suflitae]|uniref:diadenylate cyclase n=1 Tax=Desulfoferrobacter suflitae TaxID=2865782 RepID=UPI002164E18E|nr:diadenylate cyclase [Desulfoferrobacter suflitae]MCK8600422.1 diadenylate cyclase [Desulfoferrobacter suflitae]